MFPAPRFCRPPPGRGARSRLRLIGWTSSCAVGGSCLILDGRTAGLSARWICRLRTIRPCSGSRRAPSRRRPPPHHSTGKNMFDQSSVIVGLEAGTSKICAVVGEINDTGALSIIGVGQSRSRGVRKGEIVDAALAAEDIRNAIVEAEQMADVEVRSVYLAVSGGHLRRCNNRAAHPGGSADRAGTDEDVQDSVH